MGGFAEGVLAGVQALGYQGPMDYVGHHSGKLDLNLAVSY